MSCGLKRLFAAVLCVVLLCSLSACGENGDAYRCTLCFSAIASTGNEASVGSFINGLTLSERRMTVYKEFLDTNTFREQLSAACGGHPTSAQLEKMIDYTLEEGLGIVTVTARSRDTVETVGEAFSRLAPEFLSAYQSNVSFQLIEETIDPFPLSWRSTQRLYMNTRAVSSGGVSLSYSDLQAFSSLADTIVVICKSRVFLEELADTCHSSLPYEELLLLISVNRVDETEILEIKMTHTDRALVERLSSAFTSVLNEKLQTIVSGTSVAEVDSPQIEAYPAL